MARALENQRSRKRFLHSGTGSIKDVQNDFKKFVVSKSHGRTEQGAELLNQSIEVHMQN